MELNKRDVWKTFSDFREWMKTNWPQEDELIQDKPNLKPMVKHGMSKRETKRMMRQNTGVSFLGDHSR